MKTETKVRRYIKSFDYSDPKQLLMVLVVVLAFLFIIKILIPIIIMGIVGVGIWMLIKRRNEDGKK